MLRDLALYSATVVLFSSLPVYFTESAVQNELALFPSEGVGGVLRNGLPNGFYTVAQSLLLSKSENGPI